MRSAIPLVFVEAATKRTASLLFSFFDQKKKKIREKKKLFLVQN
jgi:hypothetical protein